MAAWQFLLAVLEGSGHGQHRQLIIELRYEGSINSAEAGELSSVHDTLAEAVVEAAASVH